MLKRCPICCGEPAFERNVNDITLLRCRACKFVYSSMADEEVESVNFSIGKEITDLYKEIQGNLDRYYFKTVAAKLSRYIGKSGRVLDIGCGNGLLLSEFGKLGWQICGCDPSPWAVEAAKQYGFTLYSCELKDKSIASNSFDLVTGTSTLEHIARPVEIINEIKRILRPNGAAYFTVPNYGGLAIRLRYATFSSNKPPWHCNFFTAETLRRLFREVGMTVIYVRSYGIPETHSVYKWVRRTFCSWRRRLKPQDKCCVLF